MATNAVQLNGSSQYGKIDNFADIDALTDGTATVELWVQEDSGSGPYEPIFHFNAAGLSTENASPSTGCNFGWGYSSTSADGYVASGVYAIASFVHIAIVYELNQKTKVYKNGAEVGYNLQQTPVGTPETADGESIYVGAYPDLSDYLHGAVGGFFRVWNYARSQAQIAANMSVNLLAANNSGLIINCRFTEGSGATVVNEASPGDDMDLVGTPTWITGPDIVTGPIEQEGFRFRNDNGDEDGATWLASQDTNITQPKNTNTRLRVLLNATDNPTSKKFRLEYRKKGVTLTPTISDNFNDNSLDSAIWLETTDSGSLLAEQNSRLEFISNNDVSCMVYLKDPLPLLGKYMQAKWVQGSDDCAMFIAPTINPASAGDIYSESDWYRLGYDGSNLYVQKKFGGGSVVTLATVGSLSDPIWIRYYIDNEGYVHFDYATSAPSVDTDWTNLYTEAFTLNNMTFAGSFYLGFDAYDTPDKGQAYLDDFAYGDRIENVWKKVY